MDVRATVDAVAIASSVWAATTPSERAALLDSIALGLESSSVELVEIAQRETNLTVVRLRGELTRTTFQLRFLAQAAREGSFLDVAIDHADGEWPMGVPRPDLRRYGVPIGPVLVYAASNFPFAFSVAGGDTASALVAGCAVVVKAHSGHPDLSDRVGAIITEAIGRSGGPTDLVRVIHGSDNGVSALRHPAIKAASFTGSVAGGRHLFDIAQSRPEPIPFYGELGSINPAFVGPAAAATKAREIARGYLDSVSGSQGQLCTKPGLLFVPAGSSIVEELAAQQLLEPARLLNERIHDGFVRGMRDLAHLESIRVVSGEIGPVEDPPRPVVLGTRIEMVLAHPEKLLAEVFGPVGVVVEYDDIDDVIALVRGLDGQLSSTVMADESAPDDVDFARRLLPALAQRVGRIAWNQWTTGLSVTYAQQHGGPYPATTVPTATSVGAASIARFLRPVAYQNFPDALLPDALKEANPLGLHRRVH